MAPFPPPSGRWTHLPPPTARSTHPIRGGRAPAANRTWTWRAYPPAPHQAESGAPRVGGGLPGACYTPPLVLASLLPPPSHPVPGTTCRWHPPRPGGPPPLLPPPPPPPRSRPARHRLCSGLTDTYRPPRPLALPLLVWLRSVSRALPRPASFPSLRIPRPPTTQHPTTPRTTGRGSRRHHAHRVPLHGDDDTAFYISV